AESPFAAGEVDEIDLLPGLRVCPPIFIDGRIALQRKPLANRVAHAGIVDSQPKPSRIDPQPGLIGRHVVGYAVLRLAGCIAADDRWAVELERIDHRAIEVIDV